MSIDLDPKCPSPYGRRVRRTALLTAGALALAGCGNEVANTSSAKQPAASDPSATAPVTPGATETATGNETNPDALAPLEIVGLNSEGFTSGFEYNAEDLSPYGALVRQWVDGDIESDDAYVERLRKLLAVPADKLSTPEDQALAFTSRLASVYNTYPATGEQVDNACRVFGSETMGNYRTDMFACFLARMPLDQKVDVVRKGTTAMNVPLAAGNPFKDYVIGSDPSDETPLKNELIRNVAVTRGQHNIERTINGDRIAIDPTNLMVIEYTFTNPETVVEDPSDDPSSLAGVQFEITIRLSDKPDATSATAQVTIGSWEKTANGNFLPASVTIGDVELSIEP